MPCPTCWLSVGEVRIAATHRLSRFSAHLCVSTCREKPQVSLEGNVPPVVSLSVQLSLLLRIVKNNS